MPVNQTNSKIFNTPFSGEYWKNAALEFKNIRTLTVAAMVIALRVLLKSVQVPLVPGVLYITFGFFANALGSMIYGPLVGLVGGAISDTIGAFLFPTGDYFFPFIITEMASSFIFGLFLYRAKPTVYRVIASRFAVVAICNIILTPIINRWYYAYFNIEKTYALFTVARLVKNAALLPAESLVLILFLRALLPATERLGLTFTGERKLTFTRESVLLIIGMGIISACIVYFYSVYYIFK